ncbi:MAG: WD40 repeat domain-containing protein [Planctomycetota bacterium]
MLLRDVQSGDADASASDRDKVVDLVVSPDGSTVYSGSDDHTVRAWSTGR